MKNAAISGRSGALIRIALCVLLAWGMAPLAAYADAQPSTVPVEREGDAASSGFSEPSIDEGLAGAEEANAGDGADGIDGVPNGTEGVEPIDAVPRSEAEAVQLFDARADAVGFAAVSDYAALQSAVAAAAPGATIEVSGSFAFVDAIIIDKALTIKGDGATVLTAASGKRHFSVDATAITGSSDIRFEGMTLNGPSSTTDGKPNGGIAVATTDTSNLADARIVVSDCTFAGNVNRETGSYGGALAVRSRTQGIELTRCVFESNSSSGDGGAVSTKNSAATLTDCSFSGNASDSHGGALNGASGTTIENSLFRGNTAGGNGGAAAFSLNRTDAVSVRGTTFADNVAGNSGGGMHILNLVLSGIPESLVENSTFVGNEVTNPTSVGRSYLGSAALIDAQTTLRNVTLAGNVAPAGSEASGAGIVLFEQGFDGTYAHTVEGCLAVGNYQDGVESNLGIMTGNPFGTQSYAPYTGAAASLVEIPAAMALGDVVAVDAGGNALLADNGGSTPTVAIVADGPADNAYKAADVTLAPPAVDQRGTARPAGADGFYDIGAFELQDSERGRELAVARLFGADRYETSRKVSTHDRTGSDVVILASGDDSHFPDALSASALSGAENNAPIVLTPTEYLSAEAKAAIEADLQPSRVIIVGDQYAVSTAVEAEVRGLLGTGAAVERIGGTNRQDTADMIYETYANDFSSTAILALATKFPDALSVSSWAAKTKSPIFLAHFGSTGLTEKTVQALSEGGFDRILVMGSSLAVSDEVVQQALRAANLGYGDYVRFNGIDRYETSSLFASWATSDDRDPSEQLSMHRAAIVRGDIHPDSLTGGALQGRDSSVVVLTDRAAVTATVESLIDSSVDDIGELRFFGDEYAVELDVVKHYINRVPYTAITWLPDSSVSIL